jgi:hypothetical protein
MAGKILTSAARDMVGLRFQDNEEPAKHTAETFQEKIKNKRREEMKRKQGRKEERKKAINRKNKKMEEDGRRNKEPLKVGEKHERTRKVVEYNVDDVLVENCKFLDEISEDIEAKEKTSEIDISGHPHPTQPVGGVI